MKISIGQNDQHVDPLRRSILLDTRAGLDRIQRLPQHKIIPEFLLLALEREQIVAIAYSDDRVSDRIGRLDVDDDTRELIRRVVLWVHRDEALHAQFVRGFLLQTQTLPGFTILAKQLVGAVGGWCSAVSPRGDVEHLGLRRIVARAFLEAGRLAGRIPRSLVDALKDEGFTHFCRLNVALEFAAIESYERLVPLITTGEREDFERILADERRHAEVFQILADSFDDDDRLRTNPDTLRRRVEAVSPWFLTAAVRPVDQSQRRRIFGAGSEVQVHRGGESEVEVTNIALDSSGFDALVRSRPGSVAIRCAFMFGYDRNDRSNIVSPRVIETIAQRALLCGATEVVVLETPTVYDRFFANRSVAEVAEYFGFVSESYRVIDVESDIRPIDFERGLATTGVSAAWMDASIRVVVSKLRTDPSEVAHLSLATLAGIGGRVDGQVHTDRLIDHRTAALMALDVAPPEFAIVDAWGHVADGPLGVMGCRRPSRQNRIYAGLDALSVDAAVLRDLGFEDPFASPFFKQADQWFGASSRPTQVNGQSGSFDNFRIPQTSRWYRFIAATAAPIYFHLSRHGELFVPAMDTAAFPPLANPSPFVRLTRWSMQRLFGLRAPDRTT